MISIFAAVSGEYQQLSSTCMLCFFNLDLSLSNLPEDLIDFLIKMLDVTWHGQQHGQRHGQLSWKELGIKMGIPPIDVMYLEVEYRTEAGSPTRTLLERLGVDGRTLNDLLAALCSPSVGRRDIVNTINRSWLLTEE